MATDTVDLLKASKMGDLSVVARGQGQDRVRLMIRNTSSKRLDAVLRRGWWRRPPPDRARAGGFRAWAWECAPTVQAVSDNSVVPVATKGGKRWPLTTQHQSFDDRSRRRIAGRDCCRSLPEFRPAYPDPRDKFTLVDITNYSTDGRMPSRYAAYACSVQARVLPRP